MQLYDIIRQFQVAVLILCFNFVIISSSQKLSTTLLASKKKYKRTNENKNIPCDYLNIPAISKFLYLTSLFFRVVPWSLRMQLEWCLFFIWQADRQIFEPYWFWGSKLHSITAADMAIWSTNTYEIQSTAVMLFSCFVLSFFAFVQFWVHFYNIL